MLDLQRLMPHSKTDSKMDEKGVRRRPHSFSRKIATATGSSARSPALHAQHCRSQRNVSQAACLL